MATTCKLLLDQRRMRDDNTFPLIIRIFHERMSTSIALDISIEMKDWDEKKSEIRKSCKKYNDIQMLNNTIKKKYSAVNDQIVGLRDKNLLSSLSVSQLKKILTNQSGKTMFCEFALHLIDSFEKTGRIGNAKVYGMAVSFIKRYNKGADLPFSQITYSLLKKMEVAYLSQNKSVNGLSVYMRTIRSIYNKAIKEGLAGEESYPFKNLEIRTEKTRKRAISKDQINKIEQIEIPEDTVLWHTKNYFLFSFYCRGMNFIDMAKLQVKNLINNRIIYARSKSRDRKLFSIEINEKINRILEYYMCHVNRNDPNSYIFPIIQRSEPLLMRKDIDNARGLFNEYLKVLAKECGITENLTSYVARHTWASAAKKMGISSEIISEGMGHSDLKTTQIYLEDFADDVLDEANKRITG